MPATLQQHLPPGARVSRYELREVLGGGGFGITYRAWDSRLHRDVAIKEFLSKDLALREPGVTAVLVRSGQGDDNQFALDRFLEEAKTLAQFDHPNIVRVTDYCEANNTAYLVMFYERGRSLSQWLAEHPGPVPEATLRQWLAPLLRGLSEVHNSGYLHRDIKPGNIYLRDQGEPLLIDFGSARQAVGRHSRSVTGVISAGYAPVEQYGSDASKQNARTDLYALGATLYRCISGVDPIDAPTRQGALNNDDPDPLTAAAEIGAGHYSAPLLELIDKLLRLRSKDRPQSAAVVQAALAALDQPVQSPAASGTRPVKQRTGTREITEAERAEAEGGKAGKQAGRGKEGARLTGRLGIGTKPPVRLARRAGAVAALVLLAVGGLLLWPGLEWRWPSMSDPSGGEDPPAVVATPSFPADPIPEASPGPSGGEDPPIAVEKPSPPADPILPETPPVEAPGRLMLELEPADAQVTLPGVDSPYRPGIELPAGEYPVVVRKSGYEEFTGTVRIEAAQRITRVIALRRAVGAVFRDALKSGGEGPAMVVLPTGSFRMGSPPGEVGREDDEGPVRTVTISKRIAMGKYEVTFDEYDYFASAINAPKPGANGWGRGSRPVIRVAWEDAKVYVRWLSAQTGKNYRLPSEAEWEYAARAGTRTRYSWGDEIGPNRVDCQSFDCEWRGKTSPVGSFAANAFGLFDMHGNVWEWVEDCWHDNYEGAPTNGSAWTNGCVSTSAVVRGGSWRDRPRPLRAANRGWFRPSYRFDSVGFRLVQDLNP